MHGFIKGLWQDQHVEALKRHVANGLSFSRISAELYAEFNVNYSRNACIGKAQRLGLSASKSAPKSDAVAHRLAVRAKEPSTRSTVGRMRSASFRSPSQRVRPLRAAPAEPLHLAFEDLQFGQCRYPFGEGPFTFCGCPAEGSWCDAHHVLVHARATA